MTHKQRIEAVLEGKKPDKVPWVPRIELWYDSHQAMGTLQGNYKGKTLSEVRKMLNIGASARKTRLFEEVLENVEIKIEENGVHTYKTYITPEGSVTERHSTNEKAVEIGAPYAKEITEHMIKEKKDYKVVEYIVNNIKYLATYDEAIAYEKEIGDEGILMIGTGHDPMFKILHGYIGYNNAYYHLSDYPMEIESLYQCIWNKNLELQDIIVDSPTGIAIHGEHFDSFMTPPPLFKKYMLPYFKGYAAKIHAVGKIVAIHSDADSKMLLNLFEQADIDMCECFCTAPMVQVTLEDALNAWEDRMVIWGGIPSNILVPSTMQYDDFVKYMDNVFHLIRTRKNRIILGVADNIMPETDIGRVEKISEMVEKFSYYVV